MMKIEIKTGGSAFCNEDGESDIYYESREIARILRELADKMESSPDSMSGSVNDINGNKVLTWERN